MTLDKEIAASAKEIFTDGYDMSIGEIVSLYRDNELIINPEYQRLFRWDIYRKSRFIESILLGIPIPPIFVFQESSGTWELVDGLQRLSTILEFMGVLKGPNGNLLEPSRLEATKLLPSLEGKMWDGDKKTSIGKIQQLTIRRSRLRVEILKKESDPQSKYELFQRLNTGGAKLSDQEIRNSIMLMIRPDFYRFIKEIVELPSFKNSTALTEIAKSEQRPMELVSRLVAYAHMPYDGKLDVNEYLDNAIINAMNDKKFPIEEFKAKILDLFVILDECVGANSFKKHKSGKASGGFSIAAYEAIAFGVLSNIDSWKALDSTERQEKLQQKVNDIWDDPVFIQNSGAGVRGTTRMINMLPHAKKFFKP